MEQRGARPFRLSRDPLTAAHVYDLVPGFGHALVVPSVTFIFEVLRVSAALWEHDVEWLPIHNVSDLIAFEIEHGIETERSAYNARLFKEVIRTGRTQLGKHGGYYDCFVPVVARGQVTAVLVAGPFALARPTSTDILDRWRWLTARQGHPADPEFAAYLTTTFGTLVLEGDAAQLFEQVLEGLAALMGQERSPGEIMAQIEQRRGALEQVRLVERTWEAVRVMTDGRSLRGLQSQYHNLLRRMLGLERPPDSVLVGLTAGRADGVDPVDEALRRNAFQRAAVGLASRIGDAVAGKAGDHGVVFLSAPGASARRSMQRLSDLADSASRLAMRELGLKVHWGAAAAIGTTPISRGYQAALDGAQAALGAGQRFVEVDIGAVTTFHPLRQLRRELGRAVEEKPALLGPRFDRYIEAVEAQSGYRMEAARGHLEAGFERVAEPLVAGGALDERSYRDLCDTLDRAAEEATTANDLFEAYRRAVADVVEAIQRPVSAQHDRSLRRALAYVHQRYTEPLVFEKVARIAGFVPNYFSQLFKAREKTTFERYVRGLRLERAKQLLASTDLDVRRVAELSGFGSSQYLARVFRTSTGKTPLEFRRATPRAPVGRPRRSGRRGA
jgi:AraC-like DNA-binding protein